MRKLLAIAAIFGAIAIGATPAAAQSGADPGDNGRYTMQQVGADLLRLDTRTGRVSQCVKGASGWACLMVPDERLALESEIARLQTDVIGLRKQMADAGARPPAVRGRDEVQLPSDAELDRVMGFMEKVWKRLMDMVQRTPEPEKKT